jgi:hypothetical protein
MDAAVLFAGANPSERDRLAELAKKFNEVRDRKLVAANGAIGELVFEAVDLDLGAILVQVLPLVFQLFTGGFNAVVVLGIIKTVLALLVKDSELSAIVYQVLDILVNILFKK